MITEQIQNLGAVQHIKHSNLILYVCKTGSGALGHGEWQAWAKRCENCVGSRYSMFMTRLILSLFCKLLWVDLRSYLRPSRIQCHLFCIGWCLGKAGAVLTTFDQQPSTKAYLQQLGHIDGQVLNWQPKPI